MVRKPPTDEEREFGARLAKARQEIGLSQSEAAAKLGIKPPRISEWERGIHIPSALAIVRIVVTLDLDPFTVYPEFAPKKIPGNHEEKA